VQWKPKSLRAVLVTSVPIRLSWIVQGMCRSAPVLCTAHVTQPRSVLFFEGCGGRQRGYVGLLCLLLLTSTAQRLLFECVDMCLKHVESCLQCAEVVNTSVVATMTSKVYGALCATQLSMLHKHLTNRSQNTGTLLRLPGTAAAMIVPLQQ
jgi:hypothetical protein